MARYLYPLNHFVEETSLSDTRIKCYFMYFTVSSILVCFFGRLFGGKTKTRKKAKAKKQVSYCN